MISDLWPPDYERINSCCFKWPLLHRERPDAHVLRSGAITGSSEPECWGPTEGSSPMLQSPQTWFQESLFIICQTRIACRARVLTPVGSEDWGQHPRKARSPPAHPPIPHSHPVRAPALWCRGLQGTEASIFLYMTQNSLKVETGRVWTCCYERLCGQPCTHLVQRGEKPLEAHMKMGLEA